MGQKRLLFKENKSSRLEALRRAISNPLTGPIARFIARSGIHPNLISGLGLLLSFLAGAGAAIGQFILAAILVVVSGIFDLLDGAVARASNKISRFGGVLDSTLDRLGEAALLLGLLVFYVREVSVVGILLVNISLVTSGLVSYIKARAEGAGVSCPVGLFTRAERIILLALGLFAGQVIIILAVISFFSLITAVQRLLYVWQQMRGKD